MNKNNIIEIIDYLPHKVIEVVCIKYKKKFVSVSPERTGINLLECPQCHKQGNIIIDNIIEVKNNG